MHHPPHGSPAGPEFDQVERDLWRILERENLAFRFVQDPVFRLDETEEEVLERLRSTGLEFGILPRVDPTDFLTIEARIGEHAGRVEIAVEESSEGSYYISFITRRTPFASALKELLDSLLGEENFDHRRATATRAYVWYSYLYRLAPAPRGAEAVRQGIPVFNFDDAEERFLELLKLAVQMLQERRKQRLWFSIYPRESEGGGILLVVGDERSSQRAKVFVRNRGPLCSYHVITENSRVGRELKEYLDIALGSHRLDPTVSRLRGRYLSLVYLVPDQPRSFERGPEAGGFEEQS